MSINLRVAVGAVAALAAVAALSACSSSNDDTGAPGRSSGTAATPSATASNSPGVPTIPTGFSYTPAGANDAVGVVLPSGMKAHTPAELRSDLATFDPLYPNPLAELADPADNADAIVAVDGIYYSDLATVPRPSGSNAVDLSTLIARAELIELKPGTSNADALAALTGAGPIADISTVQAIDPPAGGQLTDARSGFQTVTGSTWAYLQGTDPATTKQYVFGVVLPAAALGNDASLQDYTAVLAGIRIPASKGTR